MTYQFSIDDPEFGRILIHQNRRSRSIRFRVEPGVGMVCSVSPFASRQDILRAIQELRPRLRRLAQSAQARDARHQVNPSFRIDTPDFTFSCREAPVDRISLHQEQQGSLVCLYPSGQDFSSPQLQRQLVSQIEESLRLRARQIFLPRMEAMAQARGLHFASLAIHKTRSVWGSCSQRGHIHLNLYLVLLPRHLQDYVMQHELTHLLCGGHGPRFWELLDQVLQGRSKALRSELKAYEPTIFCLHNLP